MNTKNLNSPAKRRRIIPVAAAVAALLVGVAIGSGSQPEPEVQVKEVVKEVEVPVTETVTEYQTPAACLESLDAGTSMVDQLVNYLGAEAEAWDAASTMNVSLLEAAAATKQTASDKLVNSVKNYSAAAEDCLAEQS